MASFTGIYYRPKRSEKKQLVVQVLLRSATLKKSHEESGHEVTARVVEKVSIHYYWPARMVAKVLIHYYSQAMPAHEAWPLTTAAMARRSVTTPQGGIS